jgi:integrase
MAQVVKRCECSRDKWGKCAHSWTVRWWGTDGKQHEKSFKRNHKLALAHARQVEAGKLSVHRGDPPPPVSLESYAGQWLAGLQRNTAHAYGSALRNHVLPAHGRRALADVAADRDGIQALLRRLSPGTARVALTALRAMMSEAARSGHVTEDRLTRLRSGPLEPVTFSFPSYDQLAALAAGMRELGPIVWIMRGCGLRPGEALAVRGQAFSSGRLRVAEQRLTDGSYAPLKARKPGDFRDVPVPSYVAEAVAELDPGYLFDIPRATFSQRFRRAADTAGLKDFRAHDLRHVFASVALSSGLPVTDVSRFLGHRSIEITYQTYSHYVPDSFGRATEVLDQEYQNWSTTGLRGRLSCVIRHPLATSSIPYTAR